MKKHIHISMLVLFGCIMLAAAPAHATGSWLDCLFGNPEKDFRPYLEDGVDQQELSFRNETWDVADWAATEKEGRDRVDMLFRGGVFSDYSRGHLRGVPTLTVGPGFYHLSSYDKARVVRLFDYVYGATRARAHTLLLEDWHTDRRIGLYTPEGLQLQ